MGVEYEHYLFANDIDRIGNLHTAQAVAEVLKGWGIVSGSPTIHRIEEVELVELGDSLDLSPKNALNLLVQYSHIEGEAVARIMGPSAYDQSNDERYITNVSIIVGQDYRVYPGDEEYFVEVTAPAMVGGKKIKPIIPGFILPGCDHYYPDEAGATPPVAQLELTRKHWPLPQNFTGIWRNGVILDCGKDLPAFLGQQVDLPATEFTREIEAAFGAPVAQIGSVY